MDFAKHQDLHTIIMLKDVIRKWWHSELCFADKNGNVVDWQTGQNIVPPHNDFCRLSLFSKEGYRRCAQSIRVLHEKFKGSKKLRGALFHECHLSFTVVGAPIYIDNEYEGFLFVEGFIRQPLTGQEAETLKVKIKELNDGATDLNRAVERLSPMHPAEVDKLTDLLEFGATEIANYEAEITKRDERIQALSSELHQLYRFENVIGTSPGMSAVFELMEKVRHSDAPVLIEGEPGTGKELIAKVIHFNGQRKERPFIAQTCSGLDEVLLESTLFGHLKGSFPAATRDRRGLLELCDGGTLFLDEVSELPPALQKKLARTLQDASFTPLGSSQPREVNVRLIASSQKKLEPLVAKGDFREELFYRLGVVRLAVPSLRDRKEDLPLLVDHLLRKHHREGQKVKGLSLDAQELFEAYGWPGNIRELENEIERLMVLGSDCEYLPAALISPRILQATDEVTGSGLIPKARAMGKLNEAVEFLEREMIAQGLIRTSHNKSRLARELGISRSNLILKIAKYGLGRPGDEEPRGEAEAEADV